MRGTQRGGKGKRGGRVEEVRGTQRGEKGRYEWKG